MYVEMQMHSDIRALKKKATYPGNIYPLLIFYSFHALALPISSMRAEYHF